MRVQAGSLALFAALHGAVALYIAPEPARTIRRDGGNAPNLFARAETNVLKRSTEDARFPLSLGLVDEVVFDGYALNLYARYLITSSLRLPSYKTMKNWDGIMLKLAVIQTTSICA